MGFQDKSSDIKLSWPYRFFCWCSGARLYLLKQCPTDFNVFFGIGLIVFLTGVMAFFSGSYAFYTVFGNQYWAAAFGLFWGVLIFSFDWYLVASLRKEDKFKKELLTAMPRLVLALFLAVVISRPLELKLFESEINAQITSIQQEKLNNYQKLLSDNYPERNELMLQNKQYEAHLAELLAQRNVLFEMFVAEAEGRSATQAVGKGSVYREKKQEYDRVNTIYNQEKDRLLPIIQQNNSLIAEIGARQRAQSRVGEASIAQGNGFLARLEAYGQLSAQNKGIKFTGIFILLLFICIESGPMLVKLMSRRGAYDALLLAEEHKVMQNADQERIKLEERTKRLIAIEREKNLSRLEEELTNNRDFTRLVMQAQSEIGHERIRRWKERELQKLDDNLADYNPSLDELIEEAKLAIQPN
jgi:hypothetical protein